jgi:hypothetical protein
MADYHGSENLWLEQYYVGSRYLVSVLLYWDNVVGIATGYGAGRQRGRSSGSGRIKNFLLFHAVQTGSGVHPASYRMVTGSSFSGGKEAGA